MCMNYYRSRADKNYISVRAVSALKPLQSEGTTSTPGTSLRRARRRKILKMTYELRASVIRVHFSSSPWGNALLHSTKILAAVV